MNVLKWTTFAFMLIGAINWGLIGAFNFNLVGYLFGDMSVISRIIYLIVGLCAVTYFVIALLDENAQDRNCYN